MATPGATGMHGKPLARGAEPGLRRDLGFWQLTAGGIGMIVGAGIYVLIGPAAAEAGGGLWLSFVITAVLSALTGLSYCELAALYPRAGAEYEYARHAFPGWIAFLVGWLMIAGLTVAAAAVSLGFARYLAQFVDVPVRVGALGLLVAATLVAITGIKHSGRLTIILSLVQVGGLAVVIAVGLPYVGDESLAPSVGAAGILGGAALVFFAFIGFDDIITLAEETKDPARTVPRALLTALAISALLYVLVAVAAVSVLGAGPLAASTRPLADVMGEAIGGRSTDGVAFVALASTANTTLLALTAASRMTFAMARSGVLPSPLTRVSRGRGVPIVAVLVSTVVAAGFMAIGDLSQVAAVTDVAVYLVFLSVNATVIILRFRAPDRERPFRVPLSIRRVPVIPVLGFVSALLMLSQLEVSAILAGAALVLAGGLFLVLFRRRLTTEPEWE